MLVAHTHNREYKRLYRRLRASSCPSRVSACPRAYVQSKWCIEYFFQPLEDAIRQRFLPVLTGQNSFSDNIRDLMALPVLQEIWSLGNIIAAFIFPRKFYRRALLFPRKYYRRQEIWSLTVSWKLATSVVNDYILNHLLLGASHQWESSPGISDTWVDDCYCRNGYIWKLLTGKIAPCTYS